MNLKWFGKEYGSQQNIMCLRKKKLKEKYRNTYYKSGLWKSVANLIFTVCLQISKNDKKSFTNKAQSFIEIVMAKFLDPIWNKAMYPAFFIASETSRGYFRYFNLHILTLTAPFVAKTFFLLTSYVFPPSSIIFRLNLTFFWSVVLFYSVLKL